MKIALRVDTTEPAQQCSLQLDPNLIVSNPEEADIIVVLGGDGFMLEMMHAYMNQKVRLYGMNCGTIGFLMNLFKSDNLVDRIQKAKRVTLHPLHMWAKDPMFLNFMF